MDDNKKGTRDKNADYQISDPDYGELIVEMVRKINNPDYLEKIYYYVNAKYNREKRTEG